MTPPCDRCARRTDTIVVGLPLWFRLVATATVVSSAALLFVSVL